MHFATYIEINYKALEKNIKLFKKQAKNKKILGVVKANAYGHGDIQIANALEKLNINFLGIARVSEGVRLRNNGINSDLIVLGGAENFEFEELVKYNLIPVIYSKKMATDLNKYLKFRNLNIKVHIKFDTGMHRLGLKPTLNNIRFFKKLSNIRIEGIMSHLLDAGNINSTWNDYQINCFKKLLLAWEKEYKKLPPFVHLQNTAGFANFNIDKVNTVRIGIGLYGYGMEGLEPVFSLYSTIKDIKKIKKGATVSYGGWYKANKSTLIGLIPVGYGDGFMCSSKNGSVIINNKKFPIIGVISMDYFIVDLLNDNSINIGSKVCIINKNLSAKYWSKVCNTNIYEILTIINPRIKRLYS
jgi:alanine racemase